MQSFLRSVKPIINKFTNSMTTLSCTLRTVNATRQLQNDVHLLFAGNNCMSEGSKIFR